MKNYLKIVSLSAAFLAAGLIASQAQTIATWTGTGGDGLWNTAANWDIGVPAEGTNALIGNGNTVNYSSPMSATKIAGVIVTNASTLNINSSGFNIELGTTARAVTVGFTNAPGSMNINSG